MSRASASSLVNVAGIVLRETANTFEVIYDIAADVEMMSYFSRLSWVRGMYIRIHAAYSC